jgi:hypothetical protein
MAPLSQPWRPLALGRAVLDAAPDFVYERRWLNGGAAGASRDRWRRVQRFDCQPLLEWRVVMDGAPLVRLQDGLPQGEKIVVSAPVDTRDFQRGFIGLQAWPRATALIGFGSHVSCLAAAAKAAGAACYFCGAPEIYSASLAERQFERAGDGGARFVHMRVGPARYARVLRGAENVFFATEDAAMMPSISSLNPYASNRVLPPAFERIAAVDGLKVLPDRLVGQPLPVDRCAVDLARADIDGAGSPSSGGGTEQPRPFASFAGDELANISAETAAREAWTGRPDSFEGLGPRALMLPWNLCNPVAIAPVLVRMMARHQMAALEKMPVVLCPYNTTWRRGQDIVEFVAEIRTRLWQSPLLGQFWLASLGTSDMRALSRKIALSAWLDVDDPELLWTSRRVRAVGIDIAVVGGNAPLSDAAFAGARRYTSVMRSTVDIRDEFGRRSYVVTVPSPVELSNWLDQEVAGPARARVAETVPNRWLDRAIQKLYRKVNDDR